MDRIGPEKPRLVVARGLAKAFPESNGKRVAALDGVDLSVPGGVLVCLLGANGSGKTTLLKVLAGLVPPDQGRVEVAGFDVSLSPDEVRRRTGFSPGEERSFYGRLTGLENLRFFGSIRGIGQDALYARLGQLEKALTLKEILAAPYQKTSSGMKQRLSLARALLHEPPVLLLDEPTKSLDPSSSDSLRMHIKKQFLEDGRAVLWSTHNIEEAWETGGEIVILSRGRIAARGSPDDLLERAKTSEPREAYRRLIS